MPHVIYSLALPCWKLQPFTGHIRDLTVPGSGTKTLMLPRGTGVVICIILFAAKAQNRSHRSELGVWDESSIGIDSFAACLKKIPICMPIMSCVGGLLKMPLLHLPVHCIALPFAFMSVNGASKLCIRILLTYVVWLSPKTAISCSCLTPTLDMPAEFRPPWEQQFAIAQCTHVAVHLHSSSTHIRSAPLNSCHAHAWGDRTEPIAM